MEPHWEEASPSCGSVSLGAPRLAFFSRQDAHPDHLYRSHCTCTSSITQQQPSPRTSPLYGFWSERARPHARTNSYRKPSLTTLPPILTGLKASTEFRMSHAPDYSLNHNSSESWPQAGKKLYIKTLKCGPSTKLGTGATSLRKTEKLRRVSNGNPYHHNTPAQTYTFYRSML